jgi:hypothetical protein
MSFDFQTDPNFPAWAEDADPSSLQAQEAMERQNEVAEFLSRYTEIEIVDGEGRRHFVLARPSAEADAVGYWALVSAGRGRYRIGVGRIFDDEMRSDGTLEISGTDTDLEFGPDRLIYISLTWDDEGLPVLALRCEETPEFWPILYRFSEPPEPPRPIEVVFPLWLGVSGRRPAGEIGIDQSGWWAKQWPRAHDLVLTDGAYSHSTDFQFIPVPFLAAR